MATIQHPIHRFEGPNILTNEQYEVIRFKLKGDATYHPFPKDNFVNQFKYSLLFYFLGWPIALGFTYIENEVFQNTGWTFFAIAGFGLFSLIRDWLSYWMFLLERNGYYRKLRKAIIKATGFENFDTTMNREIV